MPARVESFFIDGPAGRIEALLEEPGDAPTRQVALLCHPHPLYGGTMHNKVVHRLSVALRRLGTLVLRFNFRGVGLSAGSFDGGRGELDDARAALNWLAGAYPELPVWLGGFSFGARIALKLGCEDERVSRIIAVGVPVEDPVIEAAQLAGCRREKILIQSTHDEFGPRALVEELFRRWPEPKRLLWVQAADHFFSDALSMLEEAVTRV